MKIEIINYKETYKIRQQVLWPEKPVEFSMIEDDPEGIHYGRYLNNDLICVASIFITGDTARLRKFATLKEFQNLGHGSMVLNYIINDLIEAGIKRFWCDARTTAESFYNKFDMIKSGDTFLKSEVEYIKMERIF